MKERKSEFRHLSLDLWMTLIRSNPGFKAERAELFRNFFSLTRKDQAEIEEAFRETDQMVNRINECVGKNIDSLEMYMMNLHRLGADLDSITNEKLEEFYQLTIELVLRKHPVLIEPNTPMILENLKKKEITISLLSNTGYTRGTTLRKILDILGIGDFFSFQLYSDEHLCSKPSSSFFSKVIEHGILIPGKEKLGFGNVLHIGDNLIADVRGAEKMGMQALLYHPEENNLSKIFSR
jgi:putative hydrolase of the HAD superfamily